MLDESAGSTQEKENQGDLKLAYMNARHRKSWLS